MTGAGDGVWGFDPPRAHTRLPSDHPGEKKRREAGEVASRRAGANTGKLFAADFYRARRVPSKESFVKQEVNADPVEHAG
jgi:hypothetical protein